MSGGHIPPPPPPPPPPVPPVETTVPAAAHEVTVDAHERPTASPVTVDLGSNTAIVDPSVLRPGKGIPEAVDRSIRKTQETSEPAD